MTRQSTPARLLIADDEPAVRRLTRRQLESDPALTVIGECADGDTALRATAKERPHAVVIDLEMPGIGGLAAIAALREAMPQLAIVALSGLSADRARSEAISAGADECLEKPASAADLETAVQRALAHQQ